jgi:phage-related tail protein
MTHNQMRLPLNTPPEPVEVGDGVGEAELVVGVGVAVVGAAVGVVGTAVGVVGTAVGVPGVGVSDGCAAAARTAPPLDRELATAP